MNYKPIDFLKNHLESMAKGCDTRFLCAVNILLKGKDVATISQLLFSMKARRHRAINEYRAVMESPDDDTYTHLIEELDSELNYLTMIDFTLDKSFGVVYKVEVDED